MKLTMLALALALMLVLGLYIEHYEIRKGPPDIRAWFSLGGAYYERGDTESARAAWRKCLGTDYDHIKRSDKRHQWKRKAMQNIKESHVREMI